MRQIKLISFLFISSVIFSLQSCQFNPKEADNNGEEEDSRPNIVFILADDMGFSDPGSFGGEIKTPNIDSLAHNGIRFTNYYNIDRCCPTRASLMTGLYNQQAGIGNMTMDDQEPGYRGYLTENTVTIAEVLKSAGYNTAMSGKWHVSNTFEKSTEEEQFKWLNHQSEDSIFSPLEQYPINRGFDKYYGTIWGVVDYFDPFSLVNDSTIVRTVPDDYYHTDAINDTAAAYVRQLSKEKEPFFLYVAHNAAHWPLMAKEQDIEKYKDTYKVGWEPIRDARYQRMVEMGLIDSATTPLSPRWHDDVKWENNKDSVWDARAMAVHAAMVDNMDQGIGRILDALKETGQLDNTLIVFMSDNGASPEVAANFGPGFDRPSQTRDGKEIFYDTEKERMPGPQTVYSSIGPHWANVANTPYQYWKAESYEGGVHSPMIAFWPEGIRLERGSFVDQLGHVMDFMPTFMDLANAEYPTEYKGRKITPMEGLSLAPIFKGKDIEGHETMFNEHVGGRYARKDDWKLVSRTNDTTWNLYRITNDRTELRNLAKEHPDIVKEMDSLWYQWADRVNVFPKPNNN